MKKALLLFALVAISVVSINAQDNLKWGVMAGMNVSKYTITGFDSRIGFHAGVKAEVGLSQDANGSGAYMDFAALLTLKGAKVDGGSLASITFNPYYLEVPVRVGYKYAVNDDFSLFGSVGPYIAVGLFGKAKAKVDGDYFDFKIDVVTCGLNQKVIISFNVPVLVDKVMDEVSADEYDALAI
ncbi:outer membrane beta-barrel protein, partial [Bacteroides xylanisolvens]|uniref:outer membrane beta-barrel protein n=1 Tax=Bacteroides xylanisolvens TaxID=371601 RepID=UPI0039B3903F